MMINNGNFDANVMHMMNNMSAAGYAGVTIFTVILYLLQSIALYKYAVAVGQENKAYKMWIPIAKDHQILMMGKMPTTWLVLIVGALIPIPIVSILFSLAYYIIYNIAIYNMVKKYNGENFAIPSILLAVLTASIGFFIYILLVLIKKQNIKNKRA